MSRAWQVTATDQSEDCLHLARDNARALKVVNIQFVQADWLAGFAGRRFDAVGGWQGLYIRHGLEEGIAVPAFLLRIHFSPSFQALQ